MRHLHDESGSTSTEVALLAPVLLMLLMVLTVAFRVTQAGAEVADVAGEAARAASIQRSPGQAAAAARATAAANLAGDTVTCVDLLVTTDTSAFTPGGLVTVTVTCAVDLSDVLLIDIDHGRTVTATRREVVDVYRGADA